MVTVRLNVVVAIAKAQALLEDGWEVYISTPDGSRYYPADFDELLSLSPALRSEAS